MPPSSWWRDDRRLGTSSHSSSSAEAAQETEQPSAEPQEASCDLKGSHPAHVTLTDDGENLVATFTGQPVADTNTTGYYITVYDKTSNNGGQLGVTYLDGEQISYFVFDEGEAVQENLPGEATVDGDTVTAKFPKSAGALADVEIAKWNAAFTLAGNDVGNCPKGNFLQPFPS